MRVHLILIWAICTEQQEEEEVKRLQKKKAEMLKMSDFDDEVTIGSCVRMRVCVRVCIDMLTYVFRIKSEGTTNKDNKKTTATTD